MGIEIIVAITIIVVVLFAALIGVLSRYRKCPSDKVLVIYGKVGNDTSGQMRSAKCIHGGAAFIIPIIQAYQYMDLTPISINVDLKNALSKQNIRVDVPSRFTVGISTEPGIMQNAAERLLGLKLAEIQELAKDIIFGQLRLVIATMDIEEINTDRDKFLLAVSNNVEIELKKIGLRLINVNVTDINDESGYIDALGKEAAAKAINDAKKSVAEKNRDGEIGHANALKDQRIQVAAADATAIQGENDAKIEVAQSDANRREKEAEALRQATAAEKVQAAMALQEAYGAQQRAEQERAALVRASQQADIVVKAEIDKQQKEIAAEAEAEVTRRKARGEADAIYARMEAQARGNRYAAAGQRGRRGSGCGGQVHHCRQAGAAGAASGGRNQEYQDRQGHRMGQHGRRRRFPHHGEFSLRYAQIHSADERAVPAGGDDPAELPRHRFGAGRRSSSGRPGRKTGGSHGFPLVTEKESMRAAAACTR